MSQRPIILIICDYYLPGFESGGAMRTIVNMVERMSDEFDFRIATRDRDGILATKPYDTVRIDDWNRVGNADVYYMSPGKTGLGSLRSLIKAVNPSAIYVNSFFSPLTIALLYLRKRRRIQSVPIILAPEGEFSEGALLIKRVKKTLYMTAAKSLQLLANITWKAAAESEVAEIQRALGNIENIHIAPNLPPVLNASDRKTIKPNKSPGLARMVFLSRYMRKKNFNWLLENLTDVGGKLLIDICGPLEEKDYWEEAQQLIEKLPKNIRIEAKGPVPHEAVAETLSQHDFFILPTIGENFGHVFIEAFEAGCPVITSDRTPWRDLEEKGVGWDLSLDAPEKWIHVINECIAMSADDFAAMSQRSQEFAAAWSSAPELEESNRAVLRAATAKGRI